MPPSPSLPPCGVAPAKANPRAPAHWLVRPATIRALWGLGLAVLAATVVAQAWIHGHEPFPLAESLGFFAWFGFAACVAMVVGAKLLGIVLKREETYYGD